MPDFGEAERELERTFVIHNALEKDAVFSISLEETQGERQLIKAKILDIESIDKIPLGPKETKKVKIRFFISLDVEIGERFQVRAEIQRKDPDPAVIGGVTFNVEVARADLEGRIVSRNIPVVAGTVTLKSVKQRGQKYSTEVKRDGTFSFKNIDPGSYRIKAKCKEGIAKGSVFANPNTITTKVLRLEFRPSRIGGILNDEKGKPIPNFPVHVRDIKKNIVHVVRTDARGRYSVPGIRPGEYEIAVPEKKIGPKKVKLDFLSQGR